MSLRLSVVLLLAIVGGCTANRMTEQKSPPGATVIMSPNKRLSFTLQTDHARPTYTISDGNTPIITSSPLVFTIDGAALTDGAMVTRVSYKEVNETYDTRGV